MTKQKEYKNMWDWQNDLEEREQNDDCIYP